MNNVYAVYDTCSGIFGDPFIAVNDATAKRMFEYSLMNVSIPKYIRDDSVLYALGSFDNASGCFTSDVPPYVVSRGSTVMVPDVPCETSPDSEVTKHAE